MGKQCGILLLLILAVECGCKPSSPATPFIPDLNATTYSGSISDSYYGAGTLIVTLTPVLGLASGTWTAAYPGRAKEPLQAISGPVSGSNYTAQVTNGSTEFSGATGCILLFSGTLTPTRLSGSYQRVVTNNCPAGTGTIDVTRQ